MKHQLRTGGILKKYDFFTNSTQVALPVSTIL